MKNSATPQTPPTIEELLGRLSVLENSHLGLTLKKGLGFSDLKISDESLGGKLPTK